MPYREKLAAYAKIARKRLDASRFEEFCARQLAHLPEVAWEFFGTDTAKDAVRLKTAALYPAHEVERFTELFWSRIQRWREEEPVASASAASATVSAPATAPSTPPAPRPARRRPTRSA